MGTYPIVTSSLLLRIPLLDSTSVALAKNICKETWTAHLNAIASNIYINIL